METIGRAIHNAIAFGAEHMSLEQDMWLMGVNAMAALFLAYILMRGAIRDNQALKRERRWN